MSKGQYRDRGKRRRGFDDDSYLQPEPLDIRPQRPFAGPPRDSAPATDGPAQSGTVKMFNDEKGFGFVALEDGEGDAFLHIATLQQAGFDAPAPGTTLRVQVGAGQKGRQVTAVLDFDASTAGSVRPRPAGPRMERPDPATATELDGTVKWFNPDKGFGFVQADDGGKDVFLHISVLEKAGLHALADGTPISMRVVQTAKGREAISLTIIA